MKLIDSLKDEELGCAILYSFTKGYSKPVPISLYQYVLPLLYLEPFQKNILCSSSYQECVDKALKENANIFEILDNQVAQDQELTNQSLGLALVKQLMEYKMDNNELKGYILPSSVLDFNEAIILGQWFSNMDTKDILKPFIRKVKKIVILDKMTLGDDIDVSCFKKLGKLEIYENTSDIQRYERVKDASYILTNKVRLDKELISKLDQLEYIGILATGLNNVDLEYCKERNIVVQNVAGYSTKSVAMHTFSKLLYLYEKMAYYDSYVKSLEYCKSNCFTHFQLPFHELHNKTWGIVGLGAIGKEVANIAKAFGCHVIYYSTSNQNNHPDYQRVDFTTLLEQSDIISIHAPLNDNTYHLFNHQTFAKMKRSAYIINVGRGGIIHEEDLAFALKHHLIAGAALDVLEQEPMTKDNPLIHIQDSTQLLITPHNAWSSHEARETLIQKACSHLEQFINKN